MPEFEAESLPEFEGNRRPAHFDTWPASGSRNEPFPSIQPSGQTDMFRERGAVEKAALLRLVRKRIELHHALARMQCLKSEANLALCDVSRQRLLADHHAAQTRVVQFDIDNPEIANLFVFRRQTAKGQ